MADLVRHHERPEGWTHRLSGCIFESDPSMRELADLPLGWRAARDGPGKPWYREPSEEGVDDGED